MKLVVLKWLKDFIVSLLGRIIEIFFRVGLLLLPIGLFMLVLQKRKGASKVSNLSVYTNDFSVWQHVFPGFILVAIDPNILDNAILSTRNALQKWIESNKYILILMALSIIIILLAVIQLKELI